MSNIGKPIRKIESNPVEIPVPDKEVVPTETPVEAPKEPVPA